MGPIHAPNTPDVFVTAAPTDSVPAGPIPGIWFIDPVSCYRETSLCLVSYANSSAGIPYGNVRVQSYDRCCWTPSAPMPRGPCCARREECPGLGRNSPTAICALDEFFTTARDTGERSILPPVGRRDSGATHAGAYRMR